MKKSLDFSIRYGKADGWMLKLCLLCLICLGGSNISLQAKTEGNEAVKMLEETSQQQKELLIRGSVKDKDGFPLPGVTVQIKGTTQGTTTDEEGEYYIMVKGVEKPVLVFSFIGMETQEVKFQKGKHRMDVVLEESTLTLQETVVTGIYTRNIESFTGSVATFSGDDLKLIGPQNILKSLSMLDPSIIITENRLQGANPNAKMDININGKMSIVDLENQYETDPNQPLFILDGFETTLETISDMNMDRVESISILKDAASTAIYGSKAANGVIVVETKKPQAGKLRVNYNGSLTVAWADLSDFNMMNSEQKLEFEKLGGAFKSSNGGMGYVNIGPDGEIIAESMMQEYYNKLRLVREGYDTYWMNEPLRTAYSRTHNLHLDGGDSAFRYGIGLSYNKNMGVMKGSDRNVFNGTVNLTYRVDNFSFSSQTNIGNTDSDNETVAFSRFSRMNPFYAKRTEDGQIARHVYKSGSETVYNPLWDFNQNSFNKSNAHNVTENLQVEWRILPELRFRGSIQYNLSKTLAEKFVSPNEISELQKDALKKGSYSNTSTNSNGYNGRLNLTYGTAIGKHTVNGVAGVTFSERNNKNFGFTVEGYQNDQFSNPNFSNGYPDGDKPTSVDNKTRSASYYANFNYSYDMRYLLDFNYTTSGASQFGIDNPFTPVWAIGIGWNIHREKWFEGSKNFNYLKLRASYGNPGNQNFNAKLAGNVYEYIRNYYNPFGMAASIQAWGNRGLKWQKTQTYNVGLDAQFFQSRLNFTLNYQYRQADPMLVNIDLPTSTGVSTTPINIGATRNNSFSANMTAYIFKQRDLNWYISANLNHNNSEYYNIGDVLEKLNEKGRAGTSLLRYHDGASLTGLYTVLSAGIDPATGNEIFVNRDGTYTYEHNQKEEILYGDTNPDVQGSINTSLTWKDFSFGASFSYRMGGDIQLSTLLNKVENISESALLNYNHDVRALTERWKKPGDISKFKRIDDRSSTPMSSRFVATENTLQCSSINIGYRTTRAKFLKSIGATSLNVTAYMNDIFRISNIKEERGLDYPFQRSFSLAFGIGF
jgi:TonB-linked SusC/RagA family outer membrane protein